MLIGLAFGVGVKWLLKWMRRRDAGRDKQICLTLAAAYLSFYVANSPAGVSGKSAFEPTPLCKGSQNKGAVNARKVCRQGTKIDSAGLQGS